MTKERLSEYHKNWYIDNKEKLSKSRRIARMKARVESLDTNMSAWTNWSMAGDKIYFQNELHRHRSYTDYFNNVYFKKKK